MSQQNVLRSEAARPLSPQDAAEEARLEAEAVRWCERMGSKLNAKKSNYRPNKRRGGSHADHR